MFKKNRVKCIICESTKNPLCCDRCGKVVCINCASEVYPEEERLMHSSYCPFCLAAIAQVNHVKAFLIPKGKFGGLTRECQKINRGWFESLLGTYLCKALAKGCLWIDTVDTGLAIAEYLEALGIHINKFNSSGIKCSPAANGMIGPADREIESLKRQDKLARLRLEAFYLNRKIKELEKQENKIHNKSGCFK